MPKSASAPFAVDPSERRRFGRYYTPEPLVGAAHRLLAEALSESGLVPKRCALVDPSCGPGAFLAREEARRYRAVLGLDLDGDALALARSKAGSAQLFEGDAYGDGLTKVAKALSGNGPVAVIGNPPYVGDSSLLKTGRYHGVRDELLPFAREVARGTSIRDDYVLFFGVADRLIEAGGGGGAIAFVTSASFIDNFLYAPMRRWLLSRYRLCSLVELGPKLFEGTRVSTALSVWVRDDAGQAGRPFGHARLCGEVPDRLAQLDHRIELSPSQPHGEAVLLNAPPTSALDDLQRMRASGEPVSAIFPISFPGLKTRFDELLVAPTQEALATRMHDFFASDAPKRFALRHGIPPSAAAKLKDAFAAREGIAFRAKALRPFARYAGVPHRFGVPEAAMGWVYLEPALIPRGDHRCHGQYDPHRHGPKLVFNVRELPLSSAVVGGEACVHDYRHSRFAPLWAPEEIVRGGLHASRRADLNRLALNLSPSWAKAAALFDCPEDLLFYVCAVLNSRAVQQRFAPWAGESEEVPVPKPTQTTRAAARAIAQAARNASPGGELPSPIESQLEHLLGLA